MIIVAIICTNQGNYIEQINYIMTNYKRDFTVFDLLGNDALVYQTLKSTKRNWCYVIGQPEQPTIVQQNPRNVVWLQQDFPYREIQELSECEDFDIVLFPIEKLNLPIWGKIAAALIKLGNFTFFVASTPNTKKILDIKNLIITKQLGHIVYDSNTLLVVNREQKTIFKGFYGSTYHYIYKIKGDYNQKVLIKRKALIKSSWKKGVNLFTYIMCQGAFPTRIDVKNKLIEIYHSPIQKMQSDNNAWNFILQGEKLIPIDLLENPMANFDHDMEKRLKRNLFWIDNPPGKPQ